MGDLVSFFSGGTLLILGLLAMVAFHPKKWGERGAEKTLQAAIFLGFLGAVTNTLYWQVFGQIAIWAEIITVSQLRSAGDWIDLFVKAICGGGSAYLHLRAIWETLPEKTQRDWSVLEMAFYPRRRWCLSALMRRLKRERTE